MQFIFFSVSDLLLSVAIDRTLSFFLSHPLSSQVEILCKIIYGRGSGRALYLHLSWRLWYFFYQPARSLIYPSTIILKSSMMLFFKGISSLPALLTSGHVDEDYERYRHAQSRRKERGGNGRVRKHVGVQPQDVTQTSPLHVRVETYASSHNRRDDLCGT